MSIYTGIIDELTKVAVSSKSMRAAKKLIGGSAPISRFLTHGIPLGGGRRGPNIPSVLFNPSSILTSGGGGRFLSSRAMMGRLARGGKGLLPGEEKLVSKLTGIKKEDIGKIQDLALKETGGKTYPISRLMTGLTPSILAGGGIGVLGGGLAGLGAGAGALVGGAGIGLLKGLDRLIGRRALTGRIAAGGKGFSKTEKKLIESLERIGRKRKIKKAIPIIGGAGLLGAGLAGGAAARDK